MFYLYIFVKHLNTFKNMEMSYFNRPMYRSIYVPSNIHHYSNSECLDCTNRTIAFLIVMNGLFVISILIMIAIWLKNNKKDDWGYKCSLWDFIMDSGFFIILSIIFLFIDVVAIIAFLVSFVASIL